MKSIVILEDNKDFKEALILGFETTPDLKCIASFSKIKDLMQQLPDIYPDLFWLDISLPDGTSIDVISQIKEIYPNSLCMICSIHDDDEKIFNALKAGADGYLLKGTNISKILEGIYDLFNGGSPMSPFIARRVLNSFVSAQNDNPKETDALKELTKREVDILSGLAQGFLYKEVANNYNIGLETVKKHVQNIYRKLHVQNRSEAIVKYLNAKK